MERKPTPHYGHAPIKMRLIDEHNDAEQVGDFYWTTFAESEQVVCYVAIPSRELKQGWIYAGITVKDEKHDGWVLTGTIKHPTFSPSVHTHGHWHGFIRDGMLIEA